jgi:predicted Fe-Mo cluster-binding NifX family protein
MPDLAAQVAQRIGISSYLIIVDSETMEIEAVPNPMAAGKQAAGITAVVIAISKKVDAVLTGCCSPTAMKYLADTGIDIVTLLPESKARWQKRWRNTRNRLTPSPLGVLKNQILPEPHYCLH